MAEQVSQRTPQKTSSAAISFTTASEFFNEDEIEKMFYQIEERLRNIDENTQGLDNKSKLLSPQEIDISLDTNWLKSILPPLKMDQVNHLIQQIVQLDTPEAAVKMADYWLSFPNVAQHQHARQVPFVANGTTTGVLTTLGGTYLFKNADRKEEKLLPTRQILTEVDMFGARLYVQTLLMYGLAKDWFVKNRLDLSDAPIKKAIVDKLVAFPARHGKQIPYSRHIVLSRDNPNLSLLATQSGSMSISEQGEKAIQETKLGELVKKKSGRFDREGAGIWYAFSQNAKLEMSPDQVNYMAKMTHTHRPETEVWRGYRNPSIALINTAMTPANLGRLKNMIKDGSTNEGDRTGAIHNVLSMPGSGEYVEQFYLLSELFVGGALMYANSLESLSYIQSKSDVEHSNLGGFLKWPQHPSSPPTRSYPDDEKNWLPFFFSLIEEDRVSHPQRSEDERMTLVKNLLTWCSTQRKLNKVYADVQQVYDCNRSGDWQMLGELNALDIDLVYGILEKKGNFIRTKSGLEQLERIYSNNIESIRNELLSNNSKSKKPTFDLSKEKDKAQYETTIQIARCFNAPLKKLGHVWKGLVAKRDLNNEAISHYEIIYKMKRELLEKRKMPKRVITLLDEVMDYKELTKGCCPLPPEVEPLVTLCETLLEEHFMNESNKLYGMALHLYPDLYRERHIQWDKINEECLAIFAGRFVQFFLTQVEHESDGNLSEAVKDKVVQLSEDAHYLMGKLDEFIPHNRYFYDIALEAKKYISQAWEQVQNDKAIAEVMSSPKKEFSPTEEGSPFPQTVEEEDYWDYSCISF